VADSLQDTFLSYVQAKDDCCGNHGPTEHGGEDEDFARFDRDPTFTPIISERYNKYAVPSLASDGSTSAINAPTMDVFRDELATALSLAWN
jgi:hypothetical protein